MAATIKINAMAIRSRIKSASNVRVINFRINLAKSSIAPEATTA